ncbi:cell wall-associated NlpC family hydrolase [Balneicella halophila]|uniref:Cell wall-associated NlpC family hydrolase n=1 Tax=Balneicella halophila TaxID=1537566 RepID=A0A7L4US85_BALHA|nr:NlpC/P60 family protein [Balneicella halophila]PVX52633.1 cell wall-associated NlpC family hydrolase [Balneicella halophila]
MRIRFAVLFLALFIYACSSTKNAPIATTSKGLSPKQATIVNYGMSYLNTPYEYAGKGPSSFDCSGFTSFVFHKVGYKLPSSSRGQASEYPKVRKRQLAVGDLVFFEGRRRNGRVGHVGIVTEVKKDGSFDFVHASVRKGVTISSSSDDYYAKRYLKAGRVLQHKDLAYNIRSNTNRATSQPEVITYIVKKGDSLYKIARKHNCTLSELREWNPGVKTLIRVGDKLQIYTHP